METVGDLIQSKATKAGYPTASALHEALTRAVEVGGAGVTISYVSVSEWWAGRTRPETLARELADFLEFTDADRLQLHELPLVPRASKSARPAA